MPISVQSIVNLPIFSTARILTGMEMLEQRQVEWMSAIEGPVENFVREQEFILTTGMGFEEDEDALFQFVQDVFRAKASALAVATGRYVMKIPKEIIDYCQEHQFILLELPWELRFSDIQRETMMEINRQQEDFSETARRIQQTLIQYVIMDKDLNDIIRHVERDLHCTIVFTDNKGRKKGTVDNPDDYIDMWYNAEEVEENYLGTFMQYHSIQGSTGSLIKKELTSGTKNLTQGYFIIYFAEEREISFYERQVLESLAAATALWISREDAIVKTEIRLRNEFIWGLAKTENMVYDENLLSRAKLFGYNLTASYICLVGYSKNFDTFSETNYGQEASGFKNIIYYIEEEVRNAASVVEKQVAFTFDGEHLIIYLELEEEEHYAVHHFLDLVDKRLHTLVPGIVFSWGIGKSGDGYMKFYESYHKAKAALEMGLTKDGEGLRHHFEDTKLKRLLLHIVKDTEVRRITLGTIEPLIAYEEKREMDLIDTFIAYDKHNGNVSQAARTLNLHRQSLLYRLRKIESLTGLSLDQPDDVFLLNLSIKVWKSQTTGKVIY